MWQVKIRTKQSDKQYLFVSYKEPVVMIEKIKTCKGKKLHYIYINESTNIKENK